MLFPCHFQRHYSWIPRNKKFYNLPFTRVWVPIKLYQRLPVFHCPHNWFQKLANAALQVWPDAISSPDQNASHGAVISLEWVKTETWLEWIAFRYVPHHRNAGSTKDSEERKTEKNNQRGLPIGFHLLRLIAFAFYCVTEEMMKIADENSGDTQIWLDLASAQHWGGVGVHILRAARPRSASRGPTWQSLTEDGDRQRQKEKCSPCEKWTLQDKVVV